MLHVCDKTGPAQGSPGDAFGLYVEQGAVASLNDISKKFLRLGCDVKKRLNGDKLIITPRNMRRRA
jgi:hypothetical protein